MLFYLKTVLVIPYLILAFLAGLLTSLVRPFHPNNVWLFCQYLYPVLPVLGVRFEIEGLQKLQDNAPAIIISNHQNNLDIFPCARSMLKRTVSLGKASIKFIPIFGQFYWLSGNILIKRENRRKAMRSMRQVQETIVNKKTSVWILPEGTRSRGRGLLPFKKGAFVTAIHAQVPIVPICYNSYHNTLDLNKWDAGMIKGRVLDPISTVGLSASDAAELAQRCHALMLNCIEQLDKEVAAANLNRKEARRQRQSLA